MRANPGITDPMSAETLSQLVGAIYDCVLDPSRWPATLSAIRRELDCHNAGITLQAMPHGEVLLNVTDGLDPQWAARVFEYGAEIVELWGGLETYNSLPLLEPLALSRISTRKFSDNRYFVEWAQPQGLIDTLAIGLTRDTSSLGSIAFGRHASAGPVGDRELACARLLIPHLHRAVVITRVLEAREMTASIFEATFDTIATPIVLIGKDLAVIHANQAAESLFRLRMPIRREKGHLVVHPRAAMTALCIAIDDLGRNESAIGDKGMGIPATTADDELCVLHVLPLNKGRMHSAPNAVAAIFVASRTTLPPALAELAQTLFGLTVAESHVLERVANGATIAEIATALGIQPSTVRTHLLHIFEKTGTHRQGDLVLLAASLATPAMTQ